MKDTIGEHRAALEYLAERDDLPCSELAETLLEISES